MSEVGGRWSDAEIPAHINALELQAVKLCLHALVADKHYIHVKVMVDNTTAAAYLHKMGGIQSVSCNDISKEIWLWAKERAIWLSSAYVPGELNVIADYKSCHFHDNTEWSLAPSLFTKITKTFFVPEVDLFATRLNCQVVGLFPGNSSREHGLLMLFHFLGKNFTFMPFLHLV